MGSLARRHVENPLHPFQFLKNCYAISPRSLLCCMPFSARFFFIFFLCLDLGSSSKDRFYYYNFGLLSLIFYYVFDGLTSFESHGVGRIFFFIVSPMPSSNFLLFATYLKRCQCPQNIPFIYSNYSTIPRWCLCTSKGSAVLSWVLVGQA
jgi:hypothetical protein